MMPLLSWVTFLLKRHWLSFLLLTVPRAGVGKNQGRYPFFPGWETKAQDGQVETLGLNPNFLSIQLREFSHEVDKVWELLIPLESGAASLADWVEQAMPGHLFLIPLEKWRREGFSNSARLAGTVDAGNSAAVCCTEGPCAPCLPLCSYPRCLLTWHAAPSWAEELLWTVQTQSIHPRGANS